MVASVLIALAIWHLGIPIAFWILRWIGRDGFLPGLRRAGLCLFAAWLCAVMVTP